MQTLAMESPELSDLLDDNIDEENGENQNDTGFELEASVGKTQNVMKATCV